MKLLYSFLVSILFFSSFAFSSSLHGTTQCDSCCNNNTDNNNQDSCIQKSEVQGIIVSKVIQCCGMVDTKSYCCVDSDVCSMHRIPQLFFLKTYNCKPKHNNNHHSNSNNMKSLASAEKIESAPVLTLLQEKTETASAAVVAALPKIASIDENKISAEITPESSSIKTLDVTAKDDVSVKATTDSNGNQTSSASSTLAWWLWLIISLCILLFVICVVFTILKCFLGVVCSAL